MKKINDISLDGNNNILLQDITGSTININPDNTQAIEDLISQNAESINQILLILKEKKEPTLQQFAQTVIAMQKAKNIHVDNTEASIKNQFNNGNFDHTTFN